MNQHFKLPLLLCRYGLFTSVNLDIIYQVLELNMKFSEFYVIPGIGVAVW